MKEIEELYEHYGKRIFNYFYYLTYDSCRADDLTQETFYQVIVSIARFKGNSSVSTWLYGIARNVFLKSLRMKKNGIIETGEESLLESIPDHEATPEETVEKKDTAALVRTVIRMLPEQYATVLILRDKEGLSYSEIGKITGLSDATVKVSIYRARQKFREEYIKLSDVTIEKR